MLKNVNKIKSAEAKQFIEVVTVLIKEGYARSFKEVAEKSGYISQDFTDLKSGKKDLKRNFLESVAKKYPINKSYVLTGEGEMLNNQTMIHEPSDGHYALAEKEKMIEWLNRELIDKREMIRHLQNVNNHLIEETNKNREEVNRLKSELDMLKEELKKKETIAK